MFTVLAVLGAVVGFLNLGRDETSRFLLAAIDLIISASSLNVPPYIGLHVALIAGYLVAFVAAAVVEVPVKSLLDAAGD